MSDVSGGPGWWLASDDKWYPPDLQPAPLPSMAPSPGWWAASDGKWYPPEQHPDYRPSPSPSPSPSPCHRPSAALPSPSLDPAEPAQPARPRVVKKKPAWPWAVAAAVVVVIIIVSVAAWGGKKGTTGGSTPTTAAAASWAGTTAPTSTPPTTSPPTTTPSTTAPPTTAPPTTVDTSAAALQFKSGEGVQNLQQFTVPAVLEGVGPHLYVQLLKPSEARICKWSRRDRLGHLHRRYRRVRVRLSDDRRRAERGRGREVAPPTPTTTPARSLSKSTRTAAGQSGWRRSRNEPTFGTKVDRALYSSAVGKPIHPTRPGTPPWMQGTKTPNPQHLHWRPSQTPCSPPRGFPWCG